MIAIIGGGISGLIAAINLETADKKCIIVEKSDRLGGRVGTDIIDGVPFDHGFQVLLTDYPYAKKYLDYAGLDLQEFEPGAVVFKDGKRSKFGDPLRNIFHLLPTAISWVGGFNDKMKIYELSKNLGLKSLDAIFDEEEQSTMDYLQKLSFSPKIIENFFRPFFGGIFLEKDLSTSSRMFEFVFKMFAEGSAAIPLKGMQEIVTQLQSKLTTTKTLLGQEPKISSDGRVMIGDNHLEISGVIKAYNKENTKWKGSTTLYYKVEKRILKGNIIGLLATSKSVINSFHYVNDETLSVTVLDGHGAEDISGQVEVELKEELGLGPVKLLKQYKIPRSLPDLTNLGHGDRSNMEVVNGLPILHAGDGLYYSSLNAAMYSGEVAAQKMLEYLSKVQ